MLSFREAFTVGCYFRDRRKQTLKIRERSPLVLGRSNRQNFYSDANDSFILLLVNEKTNNEYNV